MKNVPASIRARLLNVAKTGGESFQQILGRFALERLLYRLAQSRHRERFIVKGAQLFALRGELHPRPTRDLDLLGYGDVTPAGLQEVFREICAILSPEDGLFFDPTKIQAQPILLMNEYSGVRVTLEAELSKARFRLQIDVGVGDAVTPKAEEQELTGLLDLPRPRLRVYPWDSVIAEKFETMVRLGNENSRIKDYYDVDWLSRNVAFQGATLTDAIARTFGRRETPLLAGIPPGLSDNYSLDPRRGRQWAALSRRIKDPKAQTGLIDVVFRVRQFLLPNGRALPLEKGWAHTWPPGGPWRLPDNRRS